MPDRRTVVVTGGTRGLGQAIVEAFVASGELVWSLARNAPKRPPGPNARFIAADVCHREQLDRAVAAIRRECGDIDVWINNAGFGRPVPFSDDAAGLWEEIFSTNFWGTVHSCRSALPAIRRPGGVIINIASIAGMMSPKGHSAYATAKAAVIALTRSLAVEYADIGIRVNALAPGPLDTEGFRAAGGDPVQRAKTIPTHRMISTSEAAAACVFIARPGCSLTGHTLVLDGGALSAGCYVGTC